MKLYNKEFRIIERKYGDKHSEYYIQIHRKFLFFKWWSDYSYLGNPTRFFRDKKSAIDYLQTRLDEEYNTIMRHKIISEEVCED